MFTLKIRLGNEGMRTGRHVATALLKVVDRLELLGDSDVYDDGEGVFGIIHDENGNTVGEWSA